MKTPFYYSNSRDREREFVRIRDNHTCQKCGLKWKEGDRRLHVHHLEKSMLGKCREKMIHIYDKENNDKLLTLCPKCHRNIHLTKQ